MVKRMLFFILSFNYWLFFSQERLFDRFPPIMPDKRLSPDIVKYSCNRSSMKIINVNFFLIGAVIENPLILKLSVRGGGN